MLITCGPTWVPIDGVRVITNRSSGELGHTIAKDLEEEGSKITLLQGPVTHVWQPGSIKVIRFQAYEELANLIHRELKKRYDIIIHLAAVSDYELKTPFRSKLNSQAQVTLRLSPTKKIIQEIKRRDPGAFLVGFKLETNFTQKTSKKKAGELIRKAGCDLVVVNGVRGKSYQAYIFDRMNRLLAQARSRQQLSKSLIRVLKAKI